MKLLKLSGEFFGQYRKLGPIFFPEKGTIGILGKTGSGKTTILNAIEMALFGNTTSKKQKEIKFQDAKKSQKWWIELIFEMGGVQYRVVRHEVTAKSFLEADGVVIQGGQKDVTDYIVNNILGMDQTAFLNAFYAKQKEVESLNKLRNEERKREIIRLLRIDEIDKAIELMRADKNKLSTLIEEQKRYTIPEKEFDEKLQELAKQQKIKSKILKKLEKEVASLETEFLDQQQKVKKLEEVQKQYIELKNNISNKENEKIIINSEILPQLKEKLNSLLEMEKKVDPLKKQIEPLNMIEEQIKLMENQKLLFERKKFLSSQKEELIQSLKAQKQLIEEQKYKIPKIDFEKEINEKQVLLNNLDSEIEKMNQKVMEMHSNLLLIKENGKQKRQELNEILKLGEKSICPVCKRELGDHQQILEHTLQEQINHLLENYNVSQKNFERENNQLLTLKEQRINIEKQYNELRMQNEQKNNLEELLARERNIFMKLKEDYSRVENELDALRDVQFNEDEYNQLVQKQNMLNRLKNELQLIVAQLKDLENVKKIISENEQRIKSIEEELVQLNKKITSLEFNQEEFNHIKKEYEIIFNRLREKEKELIEAKQSLETLKKNIKDTKEKKKENDKNIKELNERKEKFSILLYLDEVFKNFKINEISKVAPSISMIMQDLLAYLTDGKYDLVELDENYNIYVYRNDKKQPLQMFSGGEQTLISLVQRLAISQIIIHKNNSKNFQFLALDEVFGPLDEELQENVLLSLTKLTNIFEQMFLISHNKNLNDKFEYTLIVEQNPDYSSKAYWNTEWDEEEVKSKIIYS